MKYTPNYLSWSQINTYLRDPKDYYVQYVLGQKREPNEPMILGSIYHSAFEDHRGAWEIDLVNAGFTSDKHRMIVDALLHLKKFPEPKLKEDKAKFLVTYSPVNLLIKLDGYTPPNKITEYKTGASNWTEERANTDGQIKFYSFVHYLKYGKVPTVTLHSFSTKTGRIVTFKIKLKVREFAPEMKRIVKDVYSGIIKGIWESV